MKPASWAIWSGSGGIPTVHRAAAAFWLAGGVMLLAWIAGLLYDAVVWGASPLLLISGLSVAAVWCRLAWSTWSTWRADRALLTLLWTGPVRESPDDAVDSGKQIGGFRLAQWDAPVRVEVVLDLQRWMLLRLTAAEGAPRQTRLWLETSSRSPLHQLRTLLYLPSRLTVAADSMPHLDGGAGRWLAHAVASWANSFKLGSKLRSSVISPRTVQSASSLALPLDSVFPSTLVMCEDDGRDQCASARAGESA